jgi:hypothetical protein
VRLKGAAATAFACHYSATFVDGTAVGPIEGGAACETESLAALESFQIVIEPRGGKTEARVPAGKTTPTAKHAAKAKQAAKPPAKRRAKA